MAQYDTHDILTGFYNHKGFLQQLSRRVAQGGNGILLIQCPRAETMNLWILRMEHAQEQIDACMLKMTFKMALSPFRSGLRDALSDAQRRIYAFSERDWNIDEFCRSIGISRGYFQRNYKAQFGISSGEDIIQARMQQAKKLLADTTLTVQEIAGQCGYKTSPHFMRQFKEQMGISTTQYRKIRKNNVGSSACCCSYGGKWNEE